MISDIVKWGCKAKSKGWFLRFDHELQDVFMKECEVMLEDCIVQNVKAERSNFFVIKMEFCIFI